MGLEFSEIVLALEDAFEIAFPDDAFLEVRTAGQLAEVVSWRLVARGDGPATDALFYRLRRALQETLGVSRAAVRPQVPLETLVPLPDRPVLWHAIGRHLGLPLPSLTRPRWMRSLISAGSAVPATGAVVSLLRSDWPALLGWSAGGFAASAVMLVSTRSSAVCIPSSCETVGETVRSLLAWNFSAAVRLTGRYHPSEVWLSVRRVVSEYLDIPEERIKPESELVADLGLG